MKHHTWSQQWLLFQNRFARIKNLTWSFESEANCMLPYLESAQLLSPDWREEMLHRNYRNWNACIKEEEWRRVCYSGCEDKRLLRGRLQTIGSQQGPDKDLPGQEKNTSLHWDHLADFVAGQQGWRKNTKDKIEPNMFAGKHHGNSWQWACKPHHLATFFNVFLWSDRMRGQI